MLIPLALFLLAQQSPAPVLELDIDQAVELALSKNSAVRIARLALEQAQAASSGALAQFGPKLQFQLRAMKFNEPPGLAGGGFDTSFVDQLRQVDELARAQGTPVDQALSGALLGFGQGLAGMSEMFSGNDYDVTVTVSVVQPLSQLWAIYQSYRQADLQVDIQRLSLARARSELAQNVRETALQLLSAEAGVEALEKAVETVQAHVARAQHFVEVGLVGKNDLLQAEARLAELEGNLCKARQGVELLLARLALLLELSAGTKLRIKEPRLDEESPTPLEPWLEKAMTRRPEIREMERRIRQAERAEKAAWQAFIPGVSLIGQYQHNQGSLMVPPAWTVGIVVDFTFWEWGASYQQLRQAELRSLQTRNALDQLRRVVELEVRASWLRLQNAQEQIIVARKALAAADEQLRIERERYEAQQNTSTDVLDAQSRLTQAEIQLKTASFEQLAARAALAKASGLDRENTLEERHE